MSESVDDILRLFKQYGDENYLGESVSKTQHMIQCAQLAETEGHDIQVILGALLHDIGHLVGMDQHTVSMVTSDGNFGAKDHDLLGGNYLQELGFPDKICDIVRGHVQAKRYLVYKNQDYYSKLSTASKITLEHQGGRMSKEEAKRFEISALFNIMISVRRWDELAKDSDVPHGDIDNYRQHMINILNKSSS